MADKTKIEWADASWNPLYGCSLLSAGCTNCYAMGVVRRFQESLGGGLVRNGPHGPLWTGKVVLSEKRLLLPLTWRKPKRIFVSSLSDPFHEAVPDEWLDRMFAVMALAQQHTFQVLTKRPERMLEYVRDNGYRMPSLPDCVCEQMGAIGGADPRRTLSSDKPGWPLPNVWLGVSTEDQPAWDLRVPALLDTPAAVRFVSAGPLLGPIDPSTAPARRRAGWLAPLTGLHRLQPTHADQRGARLDWIIVGGESGRSGRPMHPQWARDIRDQCEAAGVAFHFKQWGEHEPGELLSDGRPEPWRRYPDGKESWILDEYLGKTPSPEILFRRVGKAKAGRLLDGRTHDGMPA